MYRVFTFILTVFLLTGCQNNNFNALSGLGGSVAASQLYKEGLPGTANWAILPFTNNTEVKGIATQIERLLMVQLPAKGVDSAKLYPEAEVITASSTLSVAHRIQSGKGWARQNGISFGITGEIGEWKHDESGRPRVSINLVVTDVRSGEVIWNSDGSSEGRQGEGLYDISRVLISDLLQSLPINRRI